MLGWTFISIYKNRDEPNLPAGQVKIKAKQCLPRRPDGLPPAFQTFPSLFCWANTPELAGIDQVIFNDHQRQTGWEQFQTITPRSVLF